jgi:hypothetical protein
MLNKIRLGFELVSNTSLVRLRGSLVRRPQCKLARDLRSPMQGFLGSRLADQPSLVAEITTRPPERRKKSALNEEPVLHMGSELLPVKTLMAVEEVTRFRACFGPVHRPVNGGSLSGEDHLPELAYAISLAVFVFLQTAPAGHCSEDLLANQTGAYLNRDVKNDSSIGGP